jgi:hypothetical protein
MEIGAQFSLGTLRGETRLEVVLPMDRSGQPVFAGEVI